MRSPFRSALAAAMVAAAFLQCHGQTAAPPHSTLSGTIVDPAGHPFSKAVYNVQLIDGAGRPIPGTTSARYLGQPIAPTTYNGRLKTDGSFAISVAQTSVMQTSDGRPAQWQITISAPESGLSITTNPSQAWSLMYATAVTADTDVSSAMSAMAQPITYIDPNGPSALTAPIFVPTPTLPGHAANKAYVDSHSGSGAVTPGGGYAIASYPISPTAQVGPASVTVDATGQSLNVPGYTTTSNPLQDSPASTAATISSIRGMLKQPWAPTTIYGYGDIVSTACGTFISTAYPNINSQPNGFPNSWVQLSGTCAGALNGTNTLNSALYTKSFVLWDSYKNPVTVTNPAYLNAYEVSNVAYLRTQASFNQDGFGGTDWAHASPAINANNIWSAPGGGSNIIHAVQVGWWDTTTSTAKKQRWIETYVNAGTAPVTGINRGWAYDSGTLPYFDVWTVPPGSTATYNGYTYFRINSPTRMSVIQQDAGTALASGNIALSAGWGGTPSIGAIKGYTNKMRFTITAGAAPAANPTITVTFPTAFNTNAPICSASQVGGTGAMPSIIAHGTESTTSTGTLVWTGTPVAGSTYEIQVSCE